VPILVPGLRWLLVSFAATLSTVSIAIKQKGSREATLPN
jgi:hypothetical protein